MWWPPVIVLAVLAAGIVYMNISWRRWRATLTPEQRAEDDARARDDLQVW